MAKTVTLNDWELLAIESGLQSMIRDWEADDKRTGNTSPGIAHGLELLKKLWGTPRAEPMPLGDLFGASL